VRQLESLLAPHFKLDIKAAKKSHRTFLDTFDWHLHRVDSLLYFDDANCVVRWWSFEGNNIAKAAIATPPEFADHISKKALRDPLQAVSEGRRLLPILQLEITTHELTLFQRNKVVARLLWVQTKAKDPSQPQSTFRNVSLTELRPLEVIGKATRDQLSDLLGAHTGPKISLETQLLEGLGSFGREPRDYSSKIQVMLSAGMRSDRAAKTICASLLNTMTANQEGTRQNLDIEFLHDFRVSVRRTRSALTQLKGIFPPVVVQRYKTGFKWLGDMTGPTRDLDVFLLKIEGYRLKLPKHLRKGLEPVRRFLQERHSREQGRLAQALGSPT